MDDVTIAARSRSALPALPDEPPAPARPSDSPRTDWPPWTAPVALIGGLVLAAVGGLCSSTSRRSRSA